MNRLCLFRILLVGLVFFSQRTLLAADDYFLLVDGIDGESVANDYAKQIEVIGMHLNMSNGSNLHLGGQGESKLTSFQDLVVTKYLDKASAPLMLKCARGQVIPSVKLSVTQAGGNHLNIS